MEQTTQQRIQPYPLRLKPVAAALERLDTGQLVVEHESQSWTIRGATASPLSGSIEIHKPLSMLSRCLTRGDTGFGESFMAGEWSSDDLVSLLRLLARNEAALNQRFQNSTWLERLAHLRNANSQRGSRRNISYHYDLGNDFYELWLDQSMTYSAAAFEYAGQPMREAQRYKNQLMLEATGATGSSNILEVGCGWGGFAEHAAAQGHRVHGITLSHEQLDFATRRLDRAGLGQRATVELRDYRDIDRQFDHVVSIEMFEAVGEDYWPTFFRQMNRALRVGGTAAMQVITIDDAAFEHYRANTDFIQKYIFPGGMLPSVERFSGCAQRHGFEVQDLGLYASDYADTLAWWTKRFNACLDEVRRLGFDERFIRMWNYYLAYCEAGFRNEHVNLARTTLTKIRDV